MYMSLYIPPHRIKLVSMQCMLYICTMLKKLYENLDFYKISPNMRDSGSSCMHGKVSFQLKFALSYLC